MHSVLSQEIPSSEPLLDNSSFRIVKLDVSTHVDFDHHEAVYRCQDDESGLIAFIGIHNRNRGPAVGGCRMWNYQSEADAITDVLRLSKGMTYKNSVSSLAFGGGKAVIFGVPSAKKRELVLEAFGRFVNTLEGRYYTAEDVGISPKDMSIVKGNTNQVYINPLNSLRFVLNKIRKDKVKLNTNFYVFTGSTVGVVPLKNKGMYIAKIDKIGTVKSSIR